MIRFIDDEIGKLSVRGSPPLRRHSNGWANFVVGVMLIGRSLSETDDSAPLQRGSAERALLRTLITRMEGTPEPSGPPPPWTPCLRGPQRSEWRIDCMIRSS